MADRKKIALCLEYPLALRGGVSVLVETLLEGLKPHFDLILVSPDSPADLAKQPVGALIQDHIFWKSSLVSPKTSRQLANDLAQKKVQLAHFHFGGNFGWGNRFPGHCPIPYTNQLGIAACSTIHSVVNPLDGFCGPQKPLWFKLAMFPLAWTGKMHVLSHLRREIAVSKHDAEKLRRWYPTMRRKIGQIYHSRLRPTIQVGTIPQREPTVLNVGHLAWRKGQVILAEAFALVADRHPEWKLLFAGDPMEQHIAENIRDVAKINRLEHRIQLLGERQDALDLMHRAGIYVQPSRQEALGLALQEAMSVGCACIGTRVGGIPELIEHERTGLLVEPAQPAQMARALETLMADTALRETYGKRAAASIFEKGMTADQMVKNHIELYESIILGSAPKP